MFVTPEIYAVAKPPFADTLKGERHAEVASYLDAFSELNEISVFEGSGPKPWGVMLARVMPPEDEFWSMRITDPEDTAGIRILGGFCGLDAFVGLTFEYRELIPPGEFSDEVGVLRETWADYFGTTPPHSGASLDDYLTNYYQPG